MAANLHRTLAWLSSIAAEHSSILVGLSGGKDSLACVDLCIRAGFSDVQCYALHFIPGLECFDKPVDDAARRLGARFQIERAKAEGRTGAVRVVPLTVHKLMHPSGALALMSGTFRPHIDEVVKKRLPKPTMNDAFATARRMSGIQLLCTGERMDESLQRRGQLHGHAHCDRTHHGPDQCGELNPATSTKAGRPICEFEHEGWLGAYTAKEMRVWPLWDWSARDVVNYLRARQIPVPGGLGKRNMSGIDLRLETLTYLKQNYPNDYERILEAFPDAEVQFKRAEYMVKDD